MGTASIINQERELSKKKKVEKCDYTFIFILSLARESLDIYGKGLSLS